MGVQSMGMGSGVDVQLIIDELVNIEQNPRQERINNKAETSESKISALGELKSSLSSLQATADKIKSADNILTYKNNSSDLTGIAITSDSAARTGSYTLNVSQLATAQKTQLSMVTDGHSFASGGLSFSINGQSHDITWSDTESLAGIRFLVNQKSATTGVQATIVSSDDGDSLILSSTDVGTTSGFSVTGNGGALDLLDYQKETDSLSSTLTHGDVVFTVSGVAYTLTIDGTNDSLSQLSQTLSDFFSSSGINISATVNGSQAYFTSDSLFTLQDASGVLFSDLTDPIEQSMGALASQVSQDLKMTIDGLQVTAQSNVVTDALEGVTLNIETATGTDQVMSISKDISKVSDNINEFVNQLNSTSALIDSFLVNTEAEQGAFASDSGIRSIISQFRNIMSTSFSSNSIATNYQLGIEFDRVSKSYAVNQTTLQSAIDSNFDDLLEFFGDSTSGIGTQFYNYINDTLDREGFLANMNSSLNDTLARLVTDQIKLDDHIANYRLRLTKQYTAMDTTVAQLQATGEFLTQWTDAMTNNNK